MTLPEALHTAARRHLDARAATWAEIYRTRRVGGHRLRDRLRPAGDFRDLRRLRMAHLRLAREHDHACRRMADCGDGATLATLAGSDRSLVRSAAAIRRRMSSRREDHVTLADSRNHDGGGR